MLVIGIIDDDEYFSLHVITGRHWVFFVKVHRYSESFSNRSVAALFEISVLQEVRNLHNNSTILIRKFQNKVILYFLNYFINDFLTLIRVGVLGLSFFCGLGKGGGG